MNHVKPFDYCLIVICLWNLYHFLWIFWFAAKKNWMETKAVQKLIRRKFLWFLFPFMILLYRLFG